MLIGLAARGIETSYSYWNDEAYTVATVRSNTAAMFHQWIIPDTAPPLYPLLLRLWIKIIGDNEVATRAFSLACASLTLTCIAIYTWRISLTSYYVAIVYLGTLPAFSRYAQEARNYALTMLLATIALICLLIILQPQAQHRQRGDSARLTFRVSLVLLSLTSYFALIYACVLLVIQVCYVQPGSRPTQQGADAATVLTLGLMVAWPAIHFLFLGDLQSSAKRFGWNQVSPIIGTLQNAGATLMPVAMESLSLGILCLCGTALLACQQEQRHNQMTLLNITALSAVMAAFILVVAVIDLVFSISTDRNFIVLLPCACLLLAHGSVGLQWRNKSTLFAFGIGGILAIQQYNISSNNLLFGKIVPYQNYKAISEALAASELCYRYNCDLSSSIPKHVVATYFSGLAIQPINLDQNPLRPAPIVQRPHRENAIIIGTNDDLQARKPGASLAWQTKQEQRRCFEPRQSWRSSVVLFAPMSLANELAAQQIFPCEQPP